MLDHCRLFCNSTFESVMRREKLLWKKKWTKFMKASSFTKSPSTVHLYLFKLEYDVHALLSSVMYILSGENSTVYTISRRWWDQNTTQVANRLNRARATYVRLLHLPPCLLNFPQICIQVESLTQQDPQFIGLPDQNYGSADLDPDQKEIITDPQQWWLLRRKFMNFWE